MERQVFILLLKKTYRHTIRLFLKSEDNNKSKVDQRNITFTTEHKVSEKERNRNARNIPAEYSTNDPKLIDALYRDTGYGKTFVAVDDPEGLKKRTSFDVTPMDADKLALKNLFKLIDLPFDNEKPVEVLRSEYSIHASAKLGVKIAESTATHVPHEPKDIHKELNTQAESARKSYLDKYGEEVPSEYYNDPAFLSALSDPDWDAKEYIAERSKPKTNVVSKEPIESGTSEIPESIEQLQQQYFEKFGKNVANLKKNDASWIKKQLAGG